MDNTREKLIELLGESLRYSGEYCGEIGDCKKCRYDKEGNNCGYAVRADYFIANGVTVQKQGRWIKHIFLGHEQWVCSECQTLGSPQWKCCPVCEAKMPLPEPPKGE